MAEGVTSQMSLEDLQAMRIDNCDYDDPVDGSVDKARLYKNATRALLTYALRRTEHAQEIVELEPEILERELAKVVAWLAVRSAANVAPLPVFQPAPRWRDE